MKSEARSRSCEVLHLSRKIILANLKALRKSAPWPPNISDEHVSCTLPGTQNASLLFQCPTPVNAFKTATSPTFCSLLTTRCTIPCACHAKRHLNVQEWNMVCFIHFDFETCFAPQWRALFHYLNFQKWSYAGVLCTFWLGNVLRATTACTFCTSQLPKVVRSWCVLYIFAWKCASCHNGVQIFISHLSRWLRTRRFSEPTFRPSEPQIIGKTQCFATFLPLRAPWLFLFSDLLSSFFFFSSLLFSDCSHLCFSICPYCRKSDSKLPSNR